MTTVFSLFIIQMCAQFVSCCRAAALKMKNCQALLSRLKMSFLTARAASRTLCRGTILIYNFSMEANGRRRYRRRQPPENKLTFLLHFYPQFSVMASFPETMCGFIGVDVSCQSNIRGTGNWQRIWWGNPHAYISADKGAVATSLRLSFASFASSFLSASHASPWNSPLLSSQEELLCFLSFMLQLHLPPHWKGGGATHPSAVWPWRGSTRAVEDLITSFIGF